MNDLMNFDNEDFGEIRTLEEGGRVLYCGSDIARALGYAIPRKALFDHCKGVLKRNALTNGGEQEMSFIPEGDVYRLISHSKLPKAQEFERWLFDFVAPRAVRGESLEPTKPMCLEDALIASLQQMKAIREEAEFARRVAESANERVTEMREIVIVKPDDEWRKNSAALVTQIGVKRGGTSYISLTYTEAYNEFSERAGVNLKLRLSRKRERALSSGATKTMADSMNFLDVIADDKRFIEIWVAIVKEMAVRFGVAGNKNAAPNASTLKAAQTI